MEIWVKKENTGRICLKIKRMKKRRVIKWSLKKSCQGLGAMMWGWVDHLLGADWVRLAEVVTIKAEEVVINRRKRNTRGQGPMSWGRTPGPREGPLTGVLGSYPGEITPLLDLATIINIIIYNNNQIIINNNNIQGVLSVETTGRTY